MTSNIKGKSAGRENPAEPFKRAVTGCLRAIARKPDLEVAFAAERPGMIAGKARLPEPPRKLGLADAAIVRGHADSIALKLACHDPLVHRKLVPGGQQARAVLPDAIAFALLGAIESLLSAVVADGMTGRRHRSNCELVAQGAANIGSALFGGICVTGTIARTATNVRAGARGPIAGMLHSLFLLLFMLIAAPLASYIPLAALASVLVVVAWNMAEKQEFATLIRSSRGDATVLLATFLLTIFRDLTEGILVGFALGAVLFINRMAQMTGIEAETPLVSEDRADDGNGDRVPYDSRLAADPDVLVYRITGAFFFGAASTVGTVLDSIADTRKAFVVDFAAVPFLDSTAANAMSRVAAKAKRQGIRLFITGASPTVRRALLMHGVRPPRAKYRETIARAIADIKGERAKPIVAPEGLAAG